MTALNNGVADRIPMMLHGFIPAAQEAGYTMNEYRNSARNIADAHIRFAEKYEMDGILVAIDTSMESSTIAVPTDYPDCEPARTIGALSTDISAIIDATHPDKLL